MKGSWADCECTHQMCTLNHERDSIRLGPRKASSNRKKHGISLEEAQSVFFDEQALLLEDTQPRHEEDRFVLLGLSASLRILVVIHALVKRT